MTNSSPSRGTGSAPALSPANLPTEAELRVADLEADGPPPREGKEQHRAAEASAGNDPKAP